MKAQELRIGNLVLSGKDKIVIYNIHKDIINYGHSQGADDGDLIEFLTGIPLTEEWLLKFGFEKLLYGVVYNKDYVEIGFNKDGFYIIQSSKTIKYVHKLQNLYFERKNQELEINK